MSSPPSQQPPFGHTLLALQEGSMKHISRSHGLLSLLLLLFFIVLSSHATRASPLPSQPKLGGQGARVDDVTLLGHAPEMDSWEMMQLDKCKEEDEECFKTRMIAEAHLDYIYTQHHKP